MCTKGLIYTPTFVHMAVFRKYVLFLASGTGSLQKAPWSLNEQKIEVSYNVGISTISISSIPGKELAISCLSALLSGTPIMEVPASQFSEAQRLYQFQLDTCQSSSLLSSCSLRDQARIRAISSHPCASATILQPLPT